MPVRGGGHGLATTTWSPTGAPSKALSFSERPIPLNNWKRDASVTTQGHEVGRNCALDQTGNFLNNIALNVVCRVAMGFTQYVEDVAVAALIYAMLF